MSQVVMKKAGDCVCETLMTKVQAGVSDLVLETTLKIKVEETVKLDIPLNIECVCTNEKDSKTPTHVRLGL